MSQCSDDSVYHTMWMDNTDQNWLRINSEGDLWTTSAQHSPWSGNSYDSLPASITGYAFSSDIGGIASPMLLSMQEQYSNNQLINSASLKQELSHSSSSDGCDSDDDSDLDKDTPEIKYKR